MSYHSAFAKLPVGSDFREREQDATGVDYYRFSGDDWTTAANRRRPAQEVRQTDFEIVDSAEDKYAFAEDDFRRAKSTAARLTALEKIASSGVDRFKFEDKDGGEREFRVETSKCGGKTLIHCYGKDSNGHEQIVMRVARNASGELEPERNKDGKPVFYYGDNWSRTMQGKSYLIGENRNEHQENDRGSKATKHHEKKDSSHKHEREQGRNKDREKDCDREKNQKNRGNDRVEERDGRRGPRLDIGRTLADAAMIAAPFLMAQLSNRNQCNDYYPYRDYPRHLPERGCRNYYDDYQHRHREPGCRNYYDNYNRHSNKGRNHQRKDPCR